MLNSGQQNLEIRSLLGDLVKQLSYLWQVNIWGNYYGPQINHKTFLRIHQKHAFTITTFPRIGRLLSILYKPNRQLTANILYYKNNERLRAVKSVIEKYRPWRHPRSLTTLSLHLNASKYSPRVASVCTDSSCCGLSKLT